MVWPRDIDWRQLRFGVELEFVDVDPASVALLDGWTLDDGESQRSLTGGWSGGEIKSPHLVWSEREQIATMLERIETAGGAMNWSCGLHVHVGLVSWGAAILPALLDATLATQDALRELFQTPAHRMLFCPSLTEAQRQAWTANPDEDLLNHSGRPQGRRCGVNVAAWYAFGTVELRYPNATLRGDEAIQSAQLALRWVAAVGAGRELPRMSTAAELAEALDMPVSGYPTPAPEPVWHHREELLNTLMIPVLQPLVAAELGSEDAEILFVRPTPEGFFVKTDSGGEVNHRFWFELDADGFHLAHMAGVKD